MLIGIIPVAVKAYSFATHVTTRLLVKQNTE
jgi:hypothetical protein